MEELNKAEHEALAKKIAEWLGFKFDYWIYPDSRKWRLPDFTTSLDACFEYIVPKLKLMYLTIWEGFEVHLAIRTPNDRYKVYIGKAETPALALCRAVEKLIQGEKE